MANSALLVDASDIVAWSDRRDAQERIPQLLRQLVLATLDDAVTSLEARAGEGVQLGGWDAIVQAIRGNAFVPSGISVWEFGTDAKPKTKADRDYQKRTSDPLGIVPAEATYIAATSRRW